MLLFPVQSFVISQKTTKTVKKFSESVISINEKYNAKSDSYLAKYNENNPNATENRLIIKTDETINNTEAVDSVNGLGYSVLQYEDKETMEEEYETFSKRGYTVEKDRILKINDGNHLLDLRTDDMDDPDERWAYESVISDEAKAMLNSQSTGKEIVIGVFDTGVNYNHEAFEGRITDTSFNMSSSGNENDCMDDNGHGTAVAGIIAECTPENVKIKPYKVVNKGGYITLSVYIAAMETIIASKDKPDIINMSIGGYLFDEDMSIETELVNELIDCGVTVCIASGNDNLPTEYCTPAESDKGIIVGAYDYTNHICGFSNYGEIDIAAPGYGVKAPDFQTDASYDYYFDGTSFACPFVSAACAYILMQNQNYTPSQVKNKLKSSAVYMGEDNEPYYGSGMLNFINLIDDIDYQTPTPSVTGGTYNDTQTVTFNNIPDGTELVYTLDKSIPSAENGMVYSSSITIDNEMQMNYVLLENEEYKSPVKSQYYTVQYLADESEFEIDENGEIIAYNGTKNNFIVPNTINDIVPTALGKRVFENSSIISIVLPESISTINQYAFRNADELKHISALGVKQINSEVFKNCFSLISENMPLVDTVISESFKNCSMLHSIDFGNSLTKISDESFAYCGLTECDLPNYIGNKGSAAGAFYKSTLISFNAPKLKKIFGVMFYQCSFLSDITSNNVENIGALALFNTYYLNELDLSSLVKCGTHAFDSCFVDYIYAPLLSRIITSSGFDIPCFGMCCYSRVIDLPSLLSIEENFFYDMFVEEIYMDNLIEMETGSICNVPDLNILKLQKIENFKYPSVDSRGLLPSIGPLEIIWLPNADFNMSIELPKTTKIVFVPKSTTVRMQTSSKDTTIYVSELANDFDVDYSHEMYLAQEFPTIVAPKNSTAGEFVAERNADMSYSLPINYSFIDSDSYINCIASYLKNNKLQVDFCMKTLMDLEQYADTIIYSFEVNGETVAANTVHTENGKTYFSYQTDSEDEQTVRAVVNIDGMLFKSEPVTVSRSAVTEPDNGCEHEWTVSSYENIYRDTVITLHCSNCQSDYNVSFSNYINSRDFAPLDLNIDGIVNAKDYEIIIKQHNNR